MSNLVRLRSTALQRYLFCIAIFLCASCNSSHFGKASNMSINPTRIATLFASTQTVCFGRFVIDVPTTAAVVYGDADIGWRIYRSAGDGHLLTERITERLRRIDRDRKFIYGAMAGPESMYGKVIDGRAPGQKIVFGRAGNVAYRVESFLKMGEDLFIQEAQPLARGTGYIEAVRELNAVAVQLRPRTFSEVPSEPGICIDGAFLPQPSALTNERITLGIRLREFPDVHFSISATMKDVVVDSDALEPRINRAEEEAKSAGHGSWFSRIKMFRRGDRQLGAWSGFEVLARKPRQDVEGESHEFAYVSQGEPNNPLVPQIEIELHTGVSDNRTGAVRPSISDEEAIAIWDKLSSSIRVRAVGQSNVPAAAKRAVALGGYSSAGDACPQNGWWQCADGGNGIEVNGGRRQYFMAGEPMPQALLLARQTLWQKVRGDQPSFQSAIPTVWKLVDYRRRARTVTVVNLAKATSAVPALADSSLSATPQEIDAASIPRGTTIETGATCPASGWWTCQEPTALDGTRWFALGDVLPMATVRNTPTWMDKLKGAPEHMLVRSAWQFVRHAERSPAAVDNRSEADASKNHSGVATPASPAADDTPSKGA